MQVLDEQRDELAKLRVARGVQIFRWLHERQRRVKALRILALQTHGLHSRAERIETGQPFGRHLEDKVIPLRVRQTHFGAGREEACGKAKRA